MARFLRVLAVSAGSVLFAAALARAQSHHFLFGVENTSCQLNIDEKAGTPSGDYKAHHSSSAFAFEWSYKENFKVRASLGTVATTVEDVDVSSNAAEGFYVSLAGALETRLESGGGLLLDLSYSSGPRSEDTSGTVEYDHKRTSFVVAYTFGDPEKARVYTGIAYNTYTLDQDGPPDMKFEENQRYSLVAGVRARSDTFAGLIEGTLGLRGDFEDVGLRVAVMFGF